MTTDVRLSVEAMPPDMVSMALPCAEVNCWTPANRQLRLEIAGATYLLAVCTKHAARVKEELKQ
jgi:hypothetical protein